MSKQPTILVIDDEAAILRVLRLNLENEGYKVHSAASAPEGLRILTEKPVDTILVDFKMPEMNGLEFLEHSIAKYPEIPVIMVTAFGTIEMAVEAMRKGAFSYLTKPMNYEEMLLLLKQAVEKKQLIHDVRELRQEVRKQNRFENIITNNIKMNEMLDIVANVAATDASVLIRGETGTGKELIAKALHYNSHRAEKPFRSINCTTLADSLLESELFGHVKGAFTGATRDRAGLFEHADGGTLFLDEIGDISANMQGKLLRVLQEMEFERLGSNETVKVDVRIIAATNRNLEEAISQGKFRGDLFFRLNVIPVFIPPLRERKDDIALLADHFLEKFCLKHKKTNRTIPAELMSMLLTHDWPGNIRELENSLERAVIFSKNERLTAADFSIFEGRDPIPPQRSRNERERLLELEKKYAGYPNTLAMIANELGVDASTLYRKRKKHGLL